MKMAIGISALILAALSMVLLLPNRLLLSSPDFLPEQIEWTGMVDVFQQTLAHLVWVCLIAITCLCILLWPNR
jgi:hypothetical protein